MFVDLLNTLPCDPNADPQVRNLLRRLRQYKGLYALSGQQQGESNEDMDSVVASHNGGRRPAIRGWDRYIGGVVPGNATSVLAQIVADWASDRVIPTISQHWTPAVNYDTAAGDGARSLPVTIDDCFTPGNTTYNRYQAWKQNLADDLSVLAVAGVPVLFRPLHEAAGTWFWWSREGAAQYVRLWRDLWTYLVNVRKIHNVLWVWCLGLDSPALDWYPGDSYVDVVTLDRYSVSTRNYVSHYPLTARFGHPRKIRAMAELGYLPSSPSAYAALPFAWSMLWSDNYITDTNSDAQLTAFYADPTTVTRATVRQFIEGTLP